MSPLDARAGDPAISVVIPSYNDATRVGDALRSIAAQTLAPIEIIVSDDASSDDTEAVVAAFASRLAPIPVRYLRNAKRSGVVETRNRGISAAAGDWVANCDSDDYWHPTKLERQVAFVRAWTGRDPIGLLGTHGYNTNDRGRVISSAVMGPTSEEDYRSVRDSSGIFFCIHSSVVFSRADFVAVGGYSEEYGAADDLHFFCKLADRGVVMNLPDRLTYYRKRAGSVQLASYWNQRRGLDRLSENQQRRLRGEAPLDADAFERHLAAAPALARLARRRREWGMYHYRRGAVAYANGQLPSALAHLIPAALLDGRRLRGGVAGVLRQRARS